MNDDVGKYHDRIIFRADNYQSEKALREALSDIAEKVLNDTARNGDDAIFPRQALTREASGKAADYLRQYLQIHAVILTQDKIGEQNCISALSPYLDALELMKTFPENDEYDPFRFLFANQKVIHNAGNLLIKQSGLFPQKDNFLINREGNIRSIQQIARAGKTSEWKRDYYYAVVSADGDGMGKFLKKLDNEDISAFSKACLDYDKQAAEAVSRYGGMPIYAGGDDLLFLAPLSGADGQSVASFCRSLRNLFIDAIRKGLRGKPDLAFPTLSFGVAVQFEKFPLYEAFDRARKLLEMAKDTERFHGEKDNILLELRKHSGQSAALLIHNPDIEAFEKLSKGARGECVDSEKPTAILYTLEHFHAVLSVLLDKTRMRLQSGDAPESVKTDFMAAWGNLFDNPGQEVSQDYTNGVGDAYFTQLLLENRRVLVPDYAVPGEFKDNSLRSLVNVLIWEKFMREKVSEQELRDSRKTEAGETS